MKFLTSAVTADGRYRYQARYDMDFQKLEEHDGFMDLIHATPEDEAKSTA